MNQNAIRKGNREKKPSRYHFYEDTDLNAFPGQKSNDQKLTTPTSKDKLPSAPEINQIAKLFCKFLNITNARYHELNESQQAELIIAQPDFSKEIDGLGFNEKKKNEGRAAKNADNDSKNLHSKDFAQTTNKESRVSIKEAKNRGSKNGKTAHNFSSCLDTDLNYHNALNQHLKNSFPNITSLSPEMFKELSIPTEMLNKNANAQTKPKQKKAATISKEQSKPFKRQSYHIAIAYHIHLKQVKNSKQEEFTDPTYAARKLRQQTQNQSQ